MNSYYLAARNKVCVFLIGVHKPGTLNLFNTVTVEKTLINKNLNYDLHRLFFLLHSLKWFRQTHA